VDLDRAFVSALVVSGLDGWKQVKALGISADLLDGAGQAIFAFVADYLQQYGSLPTIDIVDGKLGVQLVDPGVPLDFLANEVVNRRLHLSLSKGYQEAVHLLEKNDPRQALNVTEQLVHTLRKDVAGDARAFPITDLDQEVLLWYERIKSGERGILTPWEKLNEATYGFWPGDLILFAARTGIGKTWISLILAHYAWSLGHRVLFATTEVGSLALALRWTALHNKISYDELRHGRLTTRDEKKMVDGFAAAKGALEGFFVVGGTFDFQLAALDLVISEVKPALVIADGANLFKSEGGSRIERAANTMDEFKRMAIRRQVPIILTLQFNREVKSGASSKTLKVEKLSQTDAGGWNADQIYGMWQTEEMRADGRMGMVPLKCREGVAKPWELTWDLHRMDFSEIDADAPSAISDADDSYGTGLDFQPSGDSNDDVVPF